MKTIAVPASRHYEVLVGQGLLAQAGERIRAMCAGSACAIVTDDTVDALYGAQVEQSLRAVGYRVVKYVFAHGEQSKNAETYVGLLNFLARNQLTRSDVLVALGGGVPGDLGGFAAATYLRGIAFVQLPTTLLAAVDSSVGGKTAIDLDAGKNLAGAFYQPWLVLCDTDTLNTLPEDIFLAGCAEVIKYGALGDEALFARLEASGPAFDREAVIACCVGHKRDIVAADEFDNGCRQLLNFGHTLGHAVEACSSFTVSHGQAVAIGMAVVTRACAAQGLCAPADAARLEALLRQFHLPVQTSYSVEELYPVMLSDKKRRSDTVNLIVPERIGKCVLRPFATDALPAFMKAGLA